MSQEIENDNMEHEESTKKTQDSSLTSKNNSKETAGEPVLEAKVVKKRSFVERWKTNRFWLVRGSYYVLNSVWMVVMAIGAFIAWLVAMLFI